ncbi:MAG: HU family DNA-binding protein [Chloroflexota bacterium]
MKKSEFIAAVAKEAGITRVEADKVVNTALTVISKVLKDGDKVTLTGFGTFEVRERAARAGMNIRTKEKIRIPASKRPVFSAGAVLRSAITGKKPTSKAVKVAVKPAAKAESKPAAKPAKNGKVTKK